MATSSDLILHHYQGSPFAQKIRSYFAFKGIPWHSVDIPVIMPKPDLTALTGGYRKTPVLQLGSDIYIDTALILAECECRFTDRPLFSKAEEAYGQGFGLEQLAAQWIDSQCFSATVSVAFDAQRKLAAGKTPSQAQKEFGAAFVKDRVKLRENGRAPLGMDPHEGRVLLLSLAQRLEVSLQTHHPFLSNPQAPSALDFSVYHCVWFLDQTAGLLASLFGQFPKLMEWYEHLSSFKQDNIPQLSSGEAIEIAKSTDLDELPDEPYAHAQHQVGDSIEIAATDYGVDPVKGRLAYEDAYRYAIIREDERAGELTLHFPKIGFKASAAV